MTDNEIIKALEMCQHGVPCDCCPYEGLECCRGNLAEDARNLINSQKAEIDKWQGGYMTQKQEIANLEIELKAMRGAANSYKAEIERLKAPQDYDPMDFCGVPCEFMERIVETEIDKLNAEKNDVMYHKAQIKAEAYKEFWEELKYRGMHPEDIPDDFAIPRSFLDKVYKNLVGEDCEKTI